MERDIIYVETYSVHTLFTLVLNKQVHAGSAACTGAVCSHVYGSLDVIPQDPGALLENYGLTSAGGDKVFQVLMKLSLVCGGERDAESESAAPALLAEG